MHFKVTHDHGEITGVEREGDWPATMKIDPFLLDHADEAFVSRSGGQVTLRTDSEVAIYGLVGERELAGERILLARLLSVAPRGER